MATLVMAIAVAGLMGAISTSLRNAARLTDHDRAVLLGHQKMDELLIATGLEKGVPFQGTWGPEVTGGGEMGWIARLTPFEVPKGGGVGTAVCRARGTGDLVDEWQPSAARSGLEAFIAPCSRRPIWRPTSSQAVAPLGPQ